jgi:hypothetical protein
MSRALTVSDTAAIRKKAARACEQARAKYEAAAAEWERYQAQDTPSFAQALKLRAGPLCEEMRALMPRYEELTDLLAEVEEEMLYSGDAPSECLARVEALNAELDQEVSETPPQAERDEPEEKREDDDEEDLWRQTLKEHGVSEEEWGDTDEEDNGEDTFDDFLRHLLGQPSRRKAARPEAAHAARIKELYRALVRRLHPDQGGDITPERIRLWHEVQTAYRCGDLARLEFLHARSGQAEELGSPSTPVSRFKALTDLFRKSLNLLKRDLRQAKADPAWAFSTLSGRERDRVLSSSVTAMRADVESVKESIRRLEARLEALRQPKRRGRKGSRFEPFADASLLDDSLLDILHLSGF